MLYVQASLHFTAREARNSTQKKNRKSVSHVAAEDPICAVEEPRADSLIVNNGLLRNLRRSLYFRLELSLEERTSWVSSRSAYPLRRARPRYGNAPRHRRQQRERQASLASGLDFRRPKIACVTTSCCKRRRIHCRAEYDCVLLRGEA